MTDILRVTVLGCGSSPGVPRPNGDWGDCDPSNPKNRRRRSSLMVQRLSWAGVTTVVIDTGPDFREQMISTGVTRIDGVVYTHPHADHIHGIDDLRTFVITQRQRIAVHADRATFERLTEAFGYCFVTPAGSDYPPILDHVGIRHGEPFSIAGEGGAITFLPVPVQHGTILNLAFRIGPLVYCTDCSGISDRSAALMTGAEVLIIDALQYRPHPAHFSLDEALDAARELEARRVILTHMHIPLDHDVVAANTPDHVMPAHDGLTFDLEYSDE